MYISILLTPCAAEDKKKGGAAKKKSVDWRAVMTSADVMIKLTKIKNKK
jgi:hypothetical protein